MVELDMFLEIRGKIERSEHKTWLLKDMKNFKFQKIGIGAYRCLGLVPVKFLGVSHYYVKIKMIPQER